MLTKILYFVQNKSFNIIYIFFFGKIILIKSFLSIIVPERAHNHTKTELLPKMLPKMFYQVQFNHIKCLVPNCPGAKLSGAKLSWCQIVRVPNCPLLLSWCQIVRFYYLGAKLSALLSWCQIVRCQIVLQSWKGVEVIILGRQVICNVMFVYQFPL